MTLPDDSGTGRTEPAREGDTERLGVLLAEIAGGDERALAVLYDATSRRIYGTTLAILRDAAAAEEATLDVYTQIWRNAGNYDPERGSALSYLLTLARTRAIDILRTRARHVSRERSLPPAFEISDPAPGPFEQHHGSELAQRVKDALAALPVDQRRAIEAAYFGGLSHTEVAAELGAPLGTIKTRIRDGLITLRRALGRFDEELAP